MSWQQLWRKKTLDHEAQPEDNPQALKRSLTRLDLVVIGLAQIIGAGIFVISGVGVQVAGPGIILSFIVSGLACTLAALCYAELASMIPQAGSAYSYAYTIFGEIFAWIIGWDLVLEYGMGASTVASGWSYYFQDLLRGSVWELPRWAAGDPLTRAGGLINLPAALIIMFLAILLVFRTKMNALVARWLVAVKLGIILFILLIGAFYVRPDYWSPLTPFGHFSVIQGAALVFFAYLGFDVVSVAAEEARNPSRDVPFGIIGSLFFCTIIYILVALVLIGMVPFTQIDPGAPFSTAFRQIGLPWAAGLISVGALVGLTSVLYILLLAQPRVLFAMGRDGLLPGWTTAVHPRFRTPHVMTLVCGTVIAICSALTPIEKLAFMCNIGTLFAFLIVCLGVLILRFTQPQARRPFRCPAGKTIALLGALASLGMMLSMPLDSWLRLGLWLIIGLGIYFLYGWQSGRLRPSRRQVEN
ncbi:MAG: amino acid permease [Deltaproteobacteria bacterium]|nr:amino acid permease [Deltaproteobacteria bacterium]